MTTVRRSTRRYEVWLRDQLKGELRKEDLTRKHEKMRESAFSFLRATYWRWAEIVLDVCPELSDGKVVLCVGDIHFENYGTWRDADGRLVWGVNDFDEAAEMPYALDLVRLAASAHLGRGRHPITDEAIAGAILLGYRQGLTNPSPIVLDRDRQWLRDLVEVSEKARSKFWKKVSGARTQRAPQRFAMALDAGMPEPGLEVRTAIRTAGSGSLGRPRWMGVAEWRGASVVREAKALVSPAWALAHKGSRREIRYDQIATGRFRPLDPWHRVNAGILVRRLSPNNRKLEVDDGAVAFSTDVLQLMGFDLANVHLGSASSDQLADDLRKRKRGWLADTSRRAADAVSNDYREWKG